MSDMKEAGALWKPVYPLDSTLLDSALLSFGNL